MLLGVSQFRSAGTFDEFAFGTPGLARTLATKLCRHRPKARAEFTNGGRR